MHKGQSDIFKYPRGITMVLLCSNAGVSFLLGFNQISYQLLIINFHVLMFSGITIRTIYIGFDSHICYGHKDQQEVFNLQLPR